MKFSEIFTYNQITYNLRGEQLRRFSAVVTHLDQTYLQHYAKKPQGSLKSEAPSE